MTLRTLKEWFKSFQHGPLRGFVAMVATIEQSVRYRSPVRVCVDQDGDWYNCRREVTYVSPELNVTNWARTHRAVMQLWCFNYELKDGDTVIDIGAGIGDDTVGFSRLVGKEGRVIAIEAHPDTYRCLQKTVSANKLDNVICLNIAISNEEGETEISSEDNYLSNNILNGVGSVKVSTRMLDDTLKEHNITKVDLIKMNIEGAETAALLGMHNTMAKTPNIVISCHDFKADRGEDPIFRTFYDVDKILREAGYSISSENEHRLPETFYYIYGEK